MPPKKAPKGKPKLAGKAPPLPKRGLAGKQKDPAKKETKAQKRRKKVDKKFTGLEFDYVPCNSLDRDELERVAKTLRSDIRETRAERLLMQLQRDYFTEIILVYLQKIRYNRDCAKLRKAQYSEAQYDLEFRDGLRKKLKTDSVDHFKKLWKELYEKRAKKRDKRIALEESKYFELYYIGELQKWEDRKQVERKARAARFAEYEEEVSDLETAEERDFVKMDKFMDKQELRRAKWNAIFDEREALELDFHEQYLNENNYEVINFTMWVFFNLRMEALRVMHGQWNFIAYDFYHWDDIDIDTRFMEIQIELYEKDQIGLEKVYNKTYWPYKHLESIHRSRVRLSHHRERTNDWIQWSEWEIEWKMDELEDEIFDNIIVNYEVSQLKEGLRHLSENCWKVARERFEIDRYEKKAAEAEERYRQLRKINQSLYEDPEDEVKDFEVARDYMYEVDEVAVAQKFKSIRIKKQHDDMARSMTARAVRLGGRTYKKYGQTKKMKKKPQRMLGRELGLGDRAAGLVAEPFYPMRPPDFKILDIFSKKERSTDADYPRAPVEKSRPHVNIFRNASDQSLSDKRRFWV